MTMRKPASDEWLEDDVRKLVLDHIHGSTNVANAMALVDKIADMIRAESKKIPTVKDEAAK